MKIDLDKYVIATDEFSFILQKKKKATKGKNEGNEYLENIGYFPNLTQLVQRLLNLKINESEGAKLQDLSTWYSLINDYIKEQIGKIEKQISHD